MGLFSNPIFTHPGNANIRRPPPPGVFFSCSRRRERSCKHFIAASGDVNFTKKIGGGSWEYNLYRAAQDKGTLKYRMSKGSDIWV